MFHPYDSSNVCSIHYLSSIYSVHHPSFIIHRPFVAIPHKVAFEGSVDRVAASLWFGFRVHRPKPSLRHSLRLVALLLTQSKLSLLPYLFLYPKFILRYRYHQQPCREGKVSSLYSSFPFLLDISCNLSRPQFTYSKIP